MDSVHFVTSAIIFYSYRSKDCPIVREESAMEKKPGPLSYRNSDVEIKSKRQLFHPFSPLLGITPVKLEDYKPVMLGKRPRPISRVDSIN